MKAVKNGAFFSHLNGRWTSARPLRRRVAKFVALRTRLVLLELIEVDTQSAVFSILTFTLHHAYPRAEESWERQICAWDTHRRAHSARKYAATRHTFLHTRQAAASRAGEPHGAAKAASDARAARPSRLIIAAVLPRRHSCHGRRLAAPRRLAAADSTSGSSERSEVSTNSARIEPPTAEETPATFYGILCSKSYLGPRRSKTTPSRARPRKRARPTSSGRRARRQRCSPLGTGPA